MPTTTLTNIYNRAVISQRQAQEEFDTAELPHRAKSKADLANATLLVVTTARGLHAALDPAADSKLGRAQSRPASIRGPSRERPTTEREDDLLRLILGRDP